MSFVIPECLGSVILLFFYHSVIDGTPKIKAVKKKKQPTAWVYDQSRVSCGKKFLGKSHRLVES